MQRFAHPMAVQDRPCTFFSLLNLPPANPEGSASFLGLSFLSVCGGWFQIFSGKLLRLRTKSNGEVAGDIDKAGSGSDGDQV